MVTPFKLVVEGTQTVQSELQQLAGYLLIPFWRSLGVTWQWLSLPYVYTESRQKQPGEAHEEHSLETQERISVEPARSPV